MFKKGLCWPLDSEQQPDQVCRRIGTLPLLGAGVGSAGVPATASILLTGCSLH